MRVLVVDDNQALTETLGLMVELMGHEVRLEHDGNKVLANALTFLPDIIFLDIGLSGISGYEVCRQLRKEPVLKHTVVIAQTGWGGKEDRQRSKEAGFDDHWVKPVRMETLEHFFSAFNPSSATA